MKKMLDAIALKKIIFRKDKQRPIRRIAQRPCQQHFAALVRQMNAD